LPPETLSPPRKVVRVVHSASDGTCQAIGHNPFVSEIAYQLYKYPNDARLAELCPKTVLAPVVLLLHV